MCGGSGPYARASRGGSSSSNEHADMRQQVTRSAVFAAVFLGLAAGVIVVGHFMASDETPGANVASPAQPARQTSTPPDGQPAVEPHHRPVRDVTPQGVSRVFMPPSALGNRRVPSASAIRISQAGATPSGEIRGEGGTVRLYGVAFPEGKKICTTSTGERWACGRRAFIALHNRMLGEEVSCEPKTAAAPPIAECYVGDVNLAAWLLAEGLAYLAPDITGKELVTAEASAKSAKRGLWSDSGETAATSAQRP
jgi:endonuclease YncB( thermonuclease family)